jgi:hypothetical protein
MRFALVTPVAPVAPVAPFPNFSAKLNLLT